MLNGLCVTANGTRLWYQNEVLNRIDGPAVECADGHKEWWIAGNLHRTDGPAVEYIDGSKEWWVNNKYLGFNDKGFWKLWDKLTDEQKNNLDLLMHMLRI